MSELWVTRGLTHISSSRIKYHCSIAQTPSDLPDHHNTSNLNISSINFLPLGWMARVEGEDWLNLAIWSIRVNGLEADSLVIGRTRFKDGGQISCNLHGLNIHLMHTEKDFILKWSKWTNRIIWWVCLKRTGIIICYLQLGTAYITT